MQLLERGMARQRSDLLLVVLLAGVGGWIGIPAGEPSLRICDICVHQLRRRWEAPAKTPATHAELHAEGSTPRRLYRDYAHKEPVTSVQLPASSQAVRDTSSLQLLRH